MSLAAGARLGPYEIQSAIGAGGMGEVYKAKDTRLDRSVAIKVLPTHVSADPERRARFSREAKTIAGLNHPHICALFDVGEAVPTNPQSPTPNTLSSVSFLVMEHLTGETLAERLEKGPLPLAQALTVATQIADALTAAHRQGIIHRDLKPANVMLTKTGVKLLDFGLAKLTGLGDQPAAASLGSAPTRTAPLTSEGTIVGTLHYMAPEQVEGKPADARTDLWALGAILYEMLSGTRAFDGPSAASLIGRIMNSEPQSLTTVQPLTPLSVDRVARKCLAKDPDARWQSASDLADELRWLSAGSGATSTVASSAGSTAPGHQRWHTPLALLSVLLVGLLSGASLWRWFAAAPSVPSAAEHLHVSLAGTGLSQPASLTISPDGARIAFRSTGDGKVYHLHVWSLRDGKLTRLDGTEGGGGNFCFSPDGGSLAFVVSNRLWRIRIGGGQPVPVTPEWEPFAAGIRWEEDGNILFGSRINTGIWRVPARGGTPELFVPPAEGEGGLRYRSPQLLPGGQAVLFTVFRPGKPSIRAYSLRTHQYVTVLADGADGRYLPATSHLIYGSPEERAYAVPFDPLKLATVGEAQALEELGILGSSTYNVSQNGTLVSLPRPNRLLTWKDRKGTETVVPVALPGDVGFLALSPDGRRAVLNLTLGSEKQLHTVNLDGGDVALMRLTQGSRDWFGTFTCDGRRLLYTVQSGPGTSNIFWWRLDRSGQAVRQTNSPNNEKASSFGPCPSGDVFLYNHFEQGQSDIWEQHLDRPETARPVVKTPASELEAAFSPDGRWIAYTSNGTLGRDEIYVQTYPDGLPMLVSTQGGRNPVWNPRGGELFYQLADSVFAVRVVGGRRVGPPVHLFDRENAGTDRTWDVSPDGQRFLVAVSSRMPSHLNVVKNWFEELKAKVPTGR